MSTFIGLVFSGISYGAIIALVGLGLILLFRATNIINFAHGILVTLGAYLAVWAIKTLGLDIGLAYVLALVLMIGIGVALERIAYAPLRKRPQMVVVISTIAASLVITAAIDLWRGSTPESLTPPFNSAVTIDGATISVQRLMVIGVVAVIVALSMVILRKTAIGRQVRSLACDREAAQLCGARVRLIAIFAFATSSFLACLAGVLISPLTTVNLTFGFGLMLSAFAAAVLGGFGSIGGVIVGALFLGLVEQVLGSYVLVNYASTLPFIVMLLVIAIRPAGFSRVVTQRL